MPSYAVSGTVLSEAMSGTDAGSSSRRSFTPTSRPVCYAPTRILIALCLAHSKPTGTDASLCPYAYMNSAYPVSPTRPQYRPSRSTVLTLYRVVLYQGFKSIVERLTPTQVILVMELYYTTCCTVIEEFGGTVGDFVGVSSAV
eukprot:1511592-Rhodomonas_salina.3